MEDEDPDVRFVAITRLHYLGSKGRQRIKALVSLLKDDDARVRREAAWTLVYGDPDGWQALTQALEDSNPRVRAAAAVGLSPAYGQKMERPEGQLRARITVMLESLSTENDAETRRDAREAAKLWAPYNR
jgi:HEAT repeat protein